MVFSLEKSLEILERTPATLVAFLSGLDDVWTQASEGPDTFSPFDVVGHLIDGEETDWIPRAQQILDSGESRPFTPYDRFRHYSRNASRTLASLLEEFADLRRTNLETLRGWQLTDEQLALTGVHPELGRVTLQQLLATWVTHDLAHIAQISRVIAKQLAGEVGPWKEYISFIRS